jgi:predicted nucleotidyltransferase
MNNISKAFVEDLKKRPDVLGIILFGSWARGNNRPDSDVDLLVILTKGFQRSVEYKEGQAFEIIYTTERGAVDYWQSNKDDCADLWNIANILFDRDGTIERLQKIGIEIREKGKEPLSFDQLEHFKFDANDQIKAVEKLVNTNSTTAKMLITAKIFSLVELFFDIRQLWTPPPKQRLEVILNKEPKLYELLVKFYDENSIVEQVTIANSIIDIVFEICKSRLV